jgi:hypothetical protein
MTAERADEGLDDWPPAVDPVRTSLVPLLEHIFAVTADGSVERSAALDAVLAVAERIKAALAPKPRLN